MAVVQQAEPEVPARPGRGGSSLRPVLWRLHFFSGLLAGPVILWLALTGIAFAWNSQIEALLYDQALTAVSDGPAQPLAEQISAAQATYPDYQVTGVVPAAPDAPQGEQTTAVTLSPPDPGTDRFGQDVGVTTVYVDPGSATVTGQILEANRPDEWIRNLHSNWRVGQGSWLEPLSELAASWVLVSLLTGLYLFWPRNRQTWAQALRARPRGSARGRWRAVHTTLGLLLLAALLVQLGTGLTWTRFAGKWIDAAQAVLVAEAPTLSTHHNGTGPHSNGSTPDGGISLERVDVVAAAAAEAGLSAPVELTPPEVPGRAWTVASIDDRWPIDTATVAIDPATGSIIDRVDWAEQPILAKATTLAINYHSGTLFGLANQIFLTLFATAVLALVAAGYRMWWLRRSAGGLGAPPRAGPLLRTAPIPLLIGFGALMVLLPMLGVSFLAYLAIERLTRRVRTRQGAHG